MRRGGDHGWSLSAGTDDALRGRLRVEERQSKGLKESERQRWHLGENEVWLLQRHLNAFA